MHLIRNKIHLAATALFLLLAGSAPAQQYTISTVAGGVPPATPVTGANTSVGQPRRVAVDGNGNVFFSAANSVFRLDTNGVLTLVAGNSRAGFSGDGGPAVKAQLNQPQGVAVDSSGNVYIADSLNAVIRKVSGGVISTIAGSPTFPGFGGDGGPAIQAQLHLPGGIAVDAAGNLYVADTVNDVVRKITTDGNINNFAGVNVPGFSGDAGPATAARLNHPSDVALDSGGNVYIADTANSCVRKVTTDGNIVTIAGNPAGGSLGDGVAATSAILGQAHGIAVDGAGILYVSEYGTNRVRKVVGGNITTVAGTISAGYSGDGAAGTSAQTNGPWGVAVDKSGNVFFADQFNYRLRKVTSSGTISTVAGNGLTSYSGDGGPASAAQFNTPLGLARDRAGNLYVADTVNNSVRKIDATGNISTAVGSLHRPQAVAVDAAGNLYIADTGNHQVSKVTFNASGNVTSNIAGNGTPGFAGDGSAATGAQLNAPRGIAVDASGNVYIADFNNNRVRRIGADGNISTVAGTGVAGYSGDGGAAASAQLDGPVAVAIDSAGVLYISDYNNYAVRKVSQGTITTIAGTGTSVSLGDGGLAVNAQLAAPAGLAVDSAGNVYIADSTRVRKVAGDGTIATIVGTGAFGYSGDGGPATNALLSGASAVAVDPGFNVYIADAGNNAIRLAQANAFTTGISSVVNGASILGGSIAPGELVVVFGAGLGPQQLTLYQLDGSGNIPTLVGGTRILFNGVPGQILYTWASQVAAVVPPSTSGASVQVIAQYLGQTSTPASVPLAAAAPGVFTRDSSGTGQAAVFNANGALNDAGHTAPVASVITLYATGLGVIPPTVNIGGQSATVKSTAAVAGGLTQINAQIPPVAAGSAVPVLVQAGSVSSQAGVTIAISSN